uniref:Secreted protein n=1 Tax=Anopheles darlingi TaxID=43151 RepID=A0A2M4DAC7_ANODA
MRMMVLGLIVCTVCLGATAVTGTIFQHTGRVLATVFVVVLVIVRIVLVVVNIRRGGKADWIVLRLDVPLVNCL